jgi:hypothetical protein
MAWSGGIFTRSNGSYSGSTVWQTDNANGFNIEASRHDTHDQDLATGINTALAKDGQNTPTANLPMGGFVHTNVGVATALTHYARASQVQASALSWAGASGGAGGAYTASISPTPSGYTAGMLVSFAPNHANGSGSVTLNLNSLGARDVLLDDGSAYVPGGFFRQSAVYTLIYSGTVFYVIGTSARRGQSWTPSFGSQAGSYSGSATFARWHNLDGSTYSVLISATGTLSTASANYLTFTLPYASENLGGAQYAPCYTFDGATEADGFFEIVNNSTEVRVYRSASAAWTVGASRAFYGNFIVELQ